MRRLVVLGALLLLAACAPGAPRWTHADTDKAIRETFAPYGPVVVQQARNIVACESGGNPYAKNGQYVGAWQLGTNYIPTVRFYNGSGDRTDPYAATKTARDSYVTRGNWSAWTCRP